MIRRSAAGRIGLVAVLLVAGCTTRERLNPLDPRNQQTAGSIPGFNAVAGDDVVSLSWTPLTQAGVLGYRLHRWKPGAAPVALGDSDYPNDADAAEDRSVRNDTTYVYRLVAHLAAGDSAVSPPDTVTPGTRRIVALGGGSAAFARLAPDARDILFALGSDDPYEDMELDRRRGVLWLPLGSAGLVQRRGFDGSLAGVSLAIEGPSDATVSPGRGLGWIASPSTGSVQAFGPDPDNPSPFDQLFSLGTPRIVEAGAADLSLWIGSDEGIVYRAQPIGDDMVIQETWDLGDPIRAIALDEAAGAAWVATRRGTLCDLFYVRAGATPTAVRVGLVAVVDLAVDPSSGSVWVSERGNPGAGAGRLSLVSPAGSTVASLTSIEPFGIDVDPGDATCWVADLRSARILHVGRDGALLGRSASLPVPYAVRVHLP